MCVYTVLCLVDFTAPFTVTKEVSKGSCDEGSISMIESMGFTRSQAIAALQATVSHVTSCDQHIQYGLYTTVVKYTAYLQIQVKYVVNAKGIM